MIGHAEAGQILEGFALPDEFLQFIRALIEAGHFPRDWEGMDALVYMLEKPWKYAGEFTVWDKTGRPMDESEQGWDEFLRLIGQ